MLPEVDTYFNVQDEFRNEFARLDREFPRQEEIEDVPDNDLAAWAQASVERELELRKVTRADNERQAAALEALKNSGDPLVKWIINSPVFEMYKAEAEEVLQALPMTREELRKFGQIWGYEFDRFFREAVVAGVFGEADEK